MANKKIKLDLGQNLESQTAAPAKKTTTTAIASKNDKKNVKAKSERPKLGQRLARVFREMISELKKVDWPAFRASKSKAGVLTNTITVLTLSLFFLIIITAFDFGLAALLKLLVSS
ncbi:MAG: preprotein translocase subunit SecE [Christensenellaceae bacterium]|jgi:preprotein translocase SecE subunit|nr:preprotein translocase subunit SecE [Christensenellaceae bacterium]